MTAGTGGSVPRLADADLGRLRIDRDRPPRRRRRRWLVAGATVAVLAACAAVVAARSGILPATRTRVEETAVVLRPARPGGGAGPILTANGYVQARRSAAVSAELQGRLVRLLVQEGSRVTAGDLLAELANADLEAQVARAEAEIHVRSSAIDEARAEQTDAANALSRARKLFERGLDTEATLDAAQARFDVVGARIAVAERNLAAGEAELRLARAELDKTRIRAPFSGTVLRKNAEIGEMVAPVSLGGSGSRGAIVTLASLDSLDVEVDVNEAYIGRLRLGQPARVTTDAYPDTGFAARVRQIVPTSDRQKATVLVKAEILRPDSRLLPDMGAKVTFLATADSTQAAAGPSGPTVTEAAVQREGGETFVWLVRPDRTVEKRVVRLGPTAAGQVEIAAGLVGGETVAVRSSRPLADGARVRLAN